MKNIVASWDRHRARDVIRTRMGANPLAFPHAFSATLTPRELSEVFAAAGTNQEFFSELERKELMSAYLTFIDRYAEHSMPYEFGYLESLNDMALALFAGEFAFGADFKVEQANFGQGTRPTLKFHAKSSEELLERILPRGADAWRLIKTATGQFVLQADAGGYSDWFVIEADVPEPELAEDACYPDLKAAIQNGWEATADPGRFLPVGNEVVMMGGAP